MAMLKRGEGFQNAVVEVIDGDNVCEECGNPLNLLESSGGEVECRKCGHGTELKDMESINE